jgi:hypothetical protein
MKNGGSIDISNLGAFGVTTLTLGLRPKRGLTKVRAKSEAQESHFMLAGF